MRPCKTQTPLRCWMCLFLLEDVAAIVVMLLPQLQGLLQLQRLIFAQLLVSFHCFRAIALLINGALLAVKPPSLRETRHEACSMLVLLSFFVVCATAMLALALALLLAAGAYAHVTSTLLWGEFCASTCLLSLGCHALLWRSCESPGPPRQEQTELLERLTRRRFLKSGRGPGESRSCIICLSDLDEGDELLELRCGHVHHTACIRQWFQRGGACPLRCPKGTERGFAG